MTKFLVFAYLILMLFGFKDSQSFFYVNKHEKTLTIDSILIKGYHNDLLSSFYKKKHYETVWLKKTNNRKLLLKHLSSCEEEGLNPAEYKLEILNGLELKFETLNDSSLIAYDVLLTLQLQKYIQQLSSGRINPKTLYKDWDLPENKIDINDQLQFLSIEDSIDIVIEKLKPNHIQYQKLKKALQIIKTYPTDTISCISYNGIINLHDFNPLMITIKNRLIYWNDLKISAPLNTQYDLETCFAIKKFQLRNGLLVDGIIGKNTIDALNFTKNNRKEQIISNLERWKWFPRRFGNKYLIINIPECYLYIVKFKDTIEKKRVVVGSIKRKTPILSSTFSSIVINPTWTVPPTILEEDILPSALKSSNYFIKKNITIYDSKNKVITPKKWIPNKYKNYRYVQSPGENNALGNLKFNYPNHYTVYLHDTNHRGFFKYNYRALSSGCVRVENPISLAVYLLNNDEYYSLYKINELIKTKKTTTINLSEKINIYQLYWTAAGLNKNGELEFLNDIYSLDEELNDILSK